MQGDDQRDVDTDMRVVHADDDHCIAVGPRLVVTFENTAPSLPHIERFRTTVRDVAAPQSPIGILIVISQDARPPGDAIRARIVRLFAELSGLVGAFSYVMEGQGFVAAAKRSALALILASKRAGFPIKVFRDCAEAVPWLVTTLGGEKASGIAMARTGSVVQRLREEHFAKRAESSR